MGTRRQSAGCNRRRMSRCGRNRQLRNFRTSAWTLPNHATRTHSEIVEFRTRRGLRTNPKYRQCMANFCTRPEQVSGPTQKPASRNFSLEAIPASRRWKLLTPQPMWISDACFQHEPDQNWQNFSLTWSTELRGTRNARQTLAGNVSRASRGCTPGKKSTTSSSPQQEM